MKLKLSSVKVGQIVIPKIEKQMLTQGKLFFVKKFKKLKKSSTTCHGPLKREEKISQNIDPQHSRFKFLNASIGGVL